MCCFSFLRGVASAWAHPGVGSLAEVAFDVGGGVLKVHGGFGRGGVRRAGCECFGFCVGWQCMTCVAAVVWCRVGVGFAAYDTADSGDALGRLFCRCWRGPVSENPYLGLGAWGGLFLSWGGWLLRVLLCFAWRRWVQCGGVSVLCWWAWGWLVWCLLTSCGAVWSLRVPSL